MPSLTLTSHDDVLAARSPAADRLVARPRHVVALAAAAAALAVFYVAGTVWAVADGFASLGDAIVNGSYISAPLPIVAAQVIGASLALATRRRAPAALTLLACTASLAAVAFDGDLGHAGVGGFEVAYQIVISVVTFAAWCLAAATVALGAGERRH